MNKRCFTFEKCELSQGCELAHTQLRDVVQFFYPRLTGEFCDSYKPVVCEQDDEIERLKQLAGCLS